MHDWVSDTHTSWLLKDEKRLEKEITQIKNSLDIRVKALEAVRLELSKRKF